MTTPGGDGILVLRALGLGDLLTGVPALRGLRRTFPGERIVLAAPAALAPLVELIAVDDLLPTEGLGQLDWPPPPPRLAVNLHGSGPESIFDVLSVEPDEVITHRHPDFPDVAGTEWRANQHDVDRWCRLLEDHGIRTDRDDLALPRPAASSAAPRAVVIHPGASFPARRWPVERFAQVARELSAAGHQVVVTGSGSEFDLAADVARAGHLSAASVLAGQTDLAGLAAIVADARLVICGDTGVGHLATAYGTPSVLLFGPTPPSEWGPPEDRKRHIVLWAGERGDPFSTEPFPGLLRLRAEDVVDAASALLSGSPISDAVGVIGAGYVGLTSAACLAHLGHRVVCVDTDTTKVTQLRRGEVALDEPELPEAVADALADRTMSFTTELGDLSACGTVLLCLPTPMGADGHADIGALESVLPELSEVLPDGAVLVTKSTVPVGTSEFAQRLMGRPDVHVVSNPEFLREGHAVEDFREPDRIVIGAADDGAAEVVASLYRRLDAPVVRTDRASAELAKYASNAFLAMKVSYANVLAELCERLGANMGDVGRIMGLDYRIGPHFLTPGPGWGGSCLPKDTEALLRIGEASGVELGMVREAVVANQHQRERIVEKIRIAVTGSPEGTLTGVRLGWV